tara:strand:- start:2716 stop:3717 length:1002 start_codon:yes stop_codon:yes gene_type:complete
LKFSIRLNNDLSINEYRNIAVQADSLGFDQLWISNDLFFRSAPVILSDLANRTKNIRLGTCILNPYTTHPAEIAMFAGTLSEVTNSRFDLGISCGASEFLNWVGIPHKKPKSHLEESVKIIRSLLLGEKPGNYGSFFKFTSEAYMRFQNDNIPIYIGGVGPNIQSLAGEIADGLLPLLLPPETYFNAKENVSRGLELSQKRLSNFDLVGSIWVSASSDVEQAKEALGEKIAYFGNAMPQEILDRIAVNRKEFEPISEALISKQDKTLALSMVTENMLKVGIAGDKSEIIKRLNPLVESGVDHVSFGPPLGPDPEKSLDILAKVKDYFSKNLTT